MSSNTIIELRQADAENVVANGDYECILAKPIIINDGDVVQMKAAFVDTVKSNENLIILNDDITLNIANGIYITDWLLTSSKTSYVNQSGGTVVGADVFPGRGQDCIPYVVIPSGSSAGVEEILGYKYFYQNQLFSKPFTITYSYLDSNNNPRTLHTTFPGNLNGFGDYTDVFTVYCKTNSIAITSPSPQFFSDAQIKIFGPIISPNPVSFDIYQPFSFTTSFIVPAGSYSPNDLSLFISEKLSRNNIGSTVNFSGLVKSNFLKTSGDFSAGTPIIASDLSVKFSFATGATTFYIGTSEMALEFNSDSNKFQFTFLHQPMLDTTGTDISVRYMNYPDLATNPPTNMAIAKNGGVFFQSLTATANGQPFDFWEGILGFDVGSLTVNSDIWVQDAFGLNGKFLKVNIVDGVTTTNGYYGLNSAIKKNDTWYTMQNDVTSTINNTVSITAANAQAELLNTYSHFILDMNMKFNNEFIGKDVNYNVQSIISRYYNYGSYAFGDVDGAVQYIHKGASIILKSIRSRILNSSKQIDDELGNDNTIYMQIIRGGVPSDVKK